MTDAHLDLAAHCAAIAAELEGVASGSDGAFVTYSRGGRDFARAAPRQLDVLLPADIAEAALRTPDAAAADEPGWVRFTPADAERHVIDRADAWFRTAWRHAAEG